MKSKFKTDPPPLWLLALRGVTFYTVLGLCIILSLSRPALADEPFIINVARENPVNRIVISGEIKGAFTPEIEETIKSGVPITFTYYLQLKRPRAIIWNKTIRTLVIKRMVKFDTLRNKYLTWVKKSMENDIDFEAELVAAGFKKDNGHEALDEKPGEQKDRATGPPAMEPDIIENLEQVKLWMTKLDRIDLGPVEDLAQSTPYYARVKCEMKSVKLIPPFSYILAFVYPMDFDTDWSVSAMFTINNASGTSATHGDKKKKELGKAE